MNAVLNLLTILDLVFDVRFYLVSILFIIFDLEVVFLFPWACTFIFLNKVAFFFCDTFPFYIGYGVLL